MSRLAVVTGASSGLGRALSASLARQGWDLVLLNRSATRSAGVLADVHAARPDAAVDVVEVDLADQDAVGRAAAAVLEAHPSVDALFLNAGVLLERAETSRHGNEMHFQVNTLAPYQLLRLLRPALAAAGSATGLVTSSGALARTGPLRVEDLRRPPAFRKLLGPYAQSKLAVSALVEALAPDYRGDGTTLRSTDPGGTRTAMTAGPGMPRLLVPLRHLAFKSVEDGARTLETAAFAVPSGSAPGSSYLVGGRPRRLPASATDPATRAALLDLCRRLTGL